MGKDANSYEEARRQRVQENLKQLECLGISKISKSLHEVVKSEKLKNFQKCHASPRSTKILETIELRRSGRARNTITSYVEMYQDNETDRRRCIRRTGTRSSNQREYNGRVASAKQQIRAIEKAEKLQDNLESNHPSFVKSMVRSHVSSCFWLGLPRYFCKEHLPDGELTMVLEDEEGVECNAIYIGGRTGLSGGWKGFANRHGLEDGDALVFELSEPERFKIYIIKAIEDNEEQSGKEKDTDPGNKAATEQASLPLKRKTTSTETKKELSVSKRPLTRQARKTAD